MFIPTLLTLLLASSPGPSARAKAIVAQLTLEEKVGLLTGVAGNYSGNLAGIPRLGVPALGMNDGPQGFRASTHGTSTAFPCALAVAAGWDATNARAFGEAIGTEFAAKGAGMMLGPALNVARLPTCGRNFEYLSGEDGGTLGAVMAAAVVGGVQSKGVIANAKHYVQNNQEYARSSVDAIVDERTHVEIYLPPFEAAVEAGVGSVMCSYNRVTIVPPFAAATYACEDPFTLTHELKERLGFGGFVVSDWGATHSTVASALAGLDMEMGSEKYYGKKLIAAVQAGHVNESAVDEKAERVLRTMIRIGPFDHTFTGNAAANVTSAAHRALARSLAAAGTVLLRNSKVGGSTGAAVLPLRHGGAPYTLCVAGGAADSVGALSGGGSGFVVGSHSTTYLEGIRTRAAAAGATVNIPSDSSIEAAQACAAAADVALVFVGTWSHESQDRDTLALTQFDQSLCAYTLQKNPHTVIVMTSPGALIVPWLENGMYLGGNAPPAALITFMPGQEAGHAVADVLWGDVNPSARLPVTLPNVDNEISLTKAMYPGVGPDVSHLRANYSERLEVGYRWYHTHGVKPAYAFGHGLSYTSFTYAVLSKEVEEPPGQTEGGGRERVVATIDFTLTNTGSRAGAEVAQLYTSFPASAGEPPVQLRNFTKIQLAAGASVRISFEVSERDLSVWDVEAGAWALVHGAHQLAVGAASDDLRLHVTVHA